MQLNKDDNNDVAYTMLVLALAAIGIVAMTVLALGADNCLTKEQARLRWPHDHLYWHSPKQCWDNQPGRGASKQPHARRSARPHNVKVVRWNDYNEIDAAADRQPYFDGEPVPIWRLAPIPHSRFRPWDERIGM